MKMLSGLMGAMAAMGGFKSPEPRFARSTGKSFRVKHHKEKPSSGKMTLFGKRVFVRPDFAKEVKP